MTLSLAMCGKNRLSSEYWIAARPICFRLFVHFVWFAFSFGLRRAGMSNVARMPMMAMTTSSSMSVKPLLRGLAMVVAPSDSIAGSVVREKTRDPGRGSPGCFEKAVTRT